MADYVAQNNSEGTFGSVINPAQSRMVASDDSDLPLICKRENGIYQKREHQMKINVLACTGGREYVEKRLSRFSGESNIDWAGGQRADGGKVDGRKQQSHCFPYAGRIANKISQYVFGTLPTRENCPEEIQNDASADGKSIDDMMRIANDYLTTCGWCWIGIDSPTFTGQISVADAKAKKVRPYLQVYSPIEVVDWKFDNIGGLEWLITETESCEITTPDEPEKEYEVRRIWTKGEVRTIKIFEDEKTGKETIVSDDTIKISYPGVPFVLVGSISDKGHPFDDIESVNRTIMDLESVNRANFFKRCYPQLVLPVSCIQNVSDAYGSQGTKSAELIVGMNYPILISKDDPVPFMLMPSGSDMGAIRTELESLKRNMFEAVGLMLANESRQVASAESKAWDFMDVSNVMRARATILEDAENKAAIICNAFDKSIAAWTAKYNRDFDIGDFSAEMNALIMSVNASMPAEMYRLVLHKILDRLDRLGSAVSPEQREIIEQAINEFSPNAMSITPDAFLATPQP